MKDLTEDITFRIASEEDITFLLDLRKKPINEHLKLSGVETSERLHMERLLLKFDCA